MELSKDESRLMKWIDDHKDEATQLLQDLIRIPSPTGEEGPGQEFVTKYLSDMGLEIETLVGDMDALKDHPEFIPVDPEINVGNYEERPNIIGTYKGAGGGKSLLLFAHIDTVPPGDGWDYDPYGAEIDGGRMYGRGTADMKSGMAAAFFSLKACLEAGLRPKGDVVCMSNIEEEIGGSGGILACIEGGYRADACIYPHPGEGKPPLVMIASSGVLSFRVKVQGQTVHGFQSHVGVNAIEKAFRIAESLWELDRSIGVTSREELTEAAYYTSGRPVRAANLYMSALHGGRMALPGPPVVRDGLGLHLPQQRDPGRKPRAHRGNRQGRGRSRPLAAGTPARAAMAAREVQPVPGRARASIHPAVPGMRKLRQRNRGADGRQSGGERHAGSRPLREDPHGQHRTSGRERTRAQ